MIEVGGCGEFGMNTGDVVALDKIVGIDIPIGIEGHPVFGDASKALDRLVLQFRDDGHQLGLQRTDRLNRNGSVYELYAWTCDGSCEASPG